MTAEDLPTSGEVFSEWLTTVFGASKEPVWFQTLTFAPLPFELHGSKRVSATRARRAGSWLSWYMTRALGSPTYFTVVESGSLNERLHLHSLISTTESYIRAAARWHETKSGFGKMQPVDSIGGVSGYVTKYIVKQPDPVWWAGGPLYGKHHLGS